MNPHTAKTPLKSRARLGALTVLGIILLLGAWVIRDRLREPAPAIPVPKDLEHLEPQLRAYLAEKIVWVSKAPRDANRHATLGLAYAANGLWHEAGSAFRNVARLNPKEPLANLYVAISTQESGDAPEALKLLRQVTVQFPNFAQGYARLGEALLRASALDEAGSAFQRLMDLAPQEWRGYAGLGDVKLRQGDHPGAVRLLEKAVELNPDARKARYLLGMAYRSIGRWEDAKLELALGTSQVEFPMPDAWSATASQHIKLLQEQIEMANELSQAGQVEQAVEMLEKALRYHPSNFSLMNNLAIAYTHAGRPDLAKELSLQILKKDDRHLPAHITLSHSYHALGMTNEALAQAEKAIALSPRTAQSHLAKANALLGMERDAETLTALQAALSCDPQNAEIEMETGDVCWLNLNQTNQAREHYLKARELNPALTPVHIRLADLYLNNGEVNEARAAIALLKRISPRAPELAALEARLERPAQVRPESKTNTQ